MTISIKFVSSEFKGREWTQFKRESGKAPKAIAHGVWKFYNSKTECWVCHKAVGVCGHPQPK